MMKRRFSAVVWREGKWFVAQCLEVDVASQGRTKEEALANLREALELFFEKPKPTVAPKLVKIEVKVGAL
jgi:predicted RNase H-like HicB family nuclease